MSSAPNRPEKPLPLRTAENAPFIDALRERRILLQRCETCRQVRYPAARQCPGCLGEQYSWIEVSGRGRVYSFIIVHQVYQAAFDGDVPYNVAVVQLDEGPRMITNLVDCSNDAIRVGMAVEPEFLALGEERTLLKFRLIAG